MKKIVLSAGVMSALVLNASAQQSPSMVRTTRKTTFGIHAGANMFNINGKNAAGVELDNGLKTGFAAGLNAEIPLGGGSYLQPGVDFRQKGTEGNDGSKLTVNYIDIPVNFVYKPILGSGNFVLGFGPYIGFGISGKLKTSGGASQDVEFTDELNTNNAAIQLKKTDAGANFLAGYEFANKLSLNLKAQLGMKDINPDVSGTNDETRYRNTGFGLSVGYRF